MLVDNQKLSHVIEILRVIDTLELPERCQPLTDYCSDEGADVGVVEEASRSLSEANAGRDRETA